LLCNGNNIGNLVPQRSSGALMLCFCGVCQHTLLKQVGLFLWYVSLHFWNCFGLFLWHISSCTSGNLMVCFCGICQNKVLTIIWSVSVADIKDKSGTTIWFVAVACQHTSGDIKVCFCGICRHTLLKIIRSLSVAGIKIYFWSSYGLFLWHMSTYTSENNMVCFCGRYQNIFLELLWSVSMAYVNTHF